MYSNWMLQSKELNPENDILNIWSTVVSLKCVMLRRVNIVSHGTTITESLPAVDIPF